VRERFRTCIIFSHLLLALSSRAIRIATMGKRLQSTGLQPDRLEKRLRRAKPICSCGSPRPAFLTAHPSFSWFSLSLSLSLSLFAKLAGNRLDLVENLKLSSKFRARTCMLVKLCVSWASLSFKWEASECRCYLKIDSNFIIPLENFHLSVFRKYCSVNFESRL
jgi:hypothetical protein